MSFIKSQLRATSSRLPKALLADLSRGYLLKFGPRENIRLCGWACITQLPLPDNSKHCGLLLTWTLRKPGTKPKAQSRKQAYYEFLPCPPVPSSHCPSFIYSFLDLTYFIFSSLGTQRPSLHTKSGAPPSPKYPHAGKWHRDIIVQDHLAGIT